MNNPAVCEGTPNGLVTMTEEELFQRIGDAYLYLVNPDLHDDSLRKGKETILSVAPLVPDELIVAMITGSSWRERLVGVCLGMSKAPSNVSEAMLRSLRDPHTIAIVPTCAALAVLSREGRFKMEPSFAGMFDRHAFDGELGWAVDHAMHHAGLRAEEVPGHGPNYNQMFEKHVELYEWIRKVAFIPPAVAKKAPGPKINLRAQMIRSLNMSVGELLHEIRGYYTKHVLEALAETPSEGCREIREGAPRDPSGALIIDGELGLPLRYDLCLISASQGAESFELDVNGLLSFEPATFHFGGETPVIRIAPFQWDRCHLRVTGVPAAFDQQILRDWFHRWFDGDDTHQTDAQGFRGVIHSLSDPVIDGEVVAFQADFGSAPIEAFEALIDSFRDLGANRIDVGER